MLSASLWDHGRRHGRSTRAVLHALLTNWTESQETQNVGFNCDHNCYFMDEVWYQRPRLKVLPEPLTCTLWLGMILRRFPGPQLLPAQTLWSVWPNLVSTVTVVVQAPPYPIAFAPFIYNRAGGPLFGISWQ